MSYDLFWQGPLNAFDHYTEKSYLDSLRADERAWSLGRYILEAIQQCMTSKPQRIYPDEPYLIKRERDQKQTEQEKTIKLYKNLMNWSAGVKARINNTPSE